MPEVTILYAAFAVVALWLLGELLLQRRAPLHWRALALLGFLVLVAGVTQRSLPLIGVGVVAFGAGQFLATQAVKKGGGATHWSLVAPESVPVVGRLFVGEEQATAPAPKGRSRRAGARPAEVAEPVAAPVVEPVSFPVAEPVAVPVATEAVEATAVFQADEYAVEGDSVYYAQTEQDQQQAAYYAYTAEQQVAYADPYADPYAQQPYAGYEQQQYQEYAPYQQPYGEQPGQQQPGQQYGRQPYAAQPYGGYEQQTYEQQSYEPQQHAQYGSYEQTPYYAADQQQHAPQG